MSMGEEETKGNQLTKEVHEALKNSSLNFVGNVEGGDIFTGRVDVIVMDGFTGNVALKASETLAEQLMNLIKEEIKRKTVRKVGALLSRAAGLEREAAAALLAQVGLEAQAERSAGVLAYGDLKKLELAVALANRPEVLLLDEPTAGMAPAERGQLMALTRRIARERELTVLFTEHDMDVVFAIADRIMVLHQGRVIAEGRPDEVRGDAQVQRVYLGEAE